MQAARQITAFMGGVLISIIEVSLQQFDEALPQLKQVIVIAGVVGGSDHSAGQDAELGPAGVAASGGGPADAADILLSSQGYTRLCTVQIDCRCPRPHAP